MRDAHRMKEKFDLSLDNRQIVSLLVGGIVVLGAVFVLGVVVGKKLSDGGAAQTGPLLANVDDDAAKLEQARALQQPEVTFHKELTQNGEEQRVAVLPPKPAEPAPEPAPAEVKPAEVVAEAPAKEPVAGKPAPVAATEPAPVEEQQPAQAVTANVKVAAETTGSLEKAYARAQQTAPAAKVTSASAAGGQFTLQLSASQSRTEADRFAAKVKDRGYPAYIVEADVPGKGTWYRVRLGRFPSKDEAGRYLSDFRRETRMDAFIAPVN